jgi:hypothetical protein
MHNVRRDIVNTYKWYRVFPRRSFLETHDKLYDGMEYQSYFFEQLRERIKDSIYDEFVSEESEWWQ